MHLRFSFSLGCFRELRLDRFTVALAVLLGGVLAYTQPAAAQQAVMVWVNPQNNSVVRGTAQVRAEGAGTIVSVEMLGLTPGGTAQVTLHGGTCALPSASVTALFNLSPGPDGRAREQGRALFHGTEDVEFDGVADGDHIISVAAGGRVVACGVIPTPAQGALEGALFNAGEQHQSFQLNPVAALQKRIFADGFVPNSGEFSLSFEDEAHTAQRAEHLASGAVRLYYLPDSSSGSVAYVQRGKAASALDEALLAEAEQRQAIRFNPGAALQKRIFGDGFVPNSGEFTVQSGDTTYTAQRAEHPSSGQVRIYYAVTGDWGKVQQVERTSVAP